MSSVKPALQRLLPTSIVRSGSWALDHLLPGRRANLSIERRRSREAAVIRSLRIRHKGIVQTGPFAGLVLPDSASWNDKTAAFCIIGSYEEELHGVIEGLIRRRPARVVNVGCAEGYYAVGFARRVPSAEVWAFDIDPQAKRLVSVTAALNNASERVHVGAACTPADLEQLIERDTVLVIDCEGCEDELLDPERAPKLRHATVLVELHDFIDASISRRLLSRFRHTHTVSLFAAGPRDPSRYATALAVLARRDRALAVDEGRPVEPHPMQWALLTPLEEHPRA